MAQEFKIGRLRFIWSGAWTTGTQYAKDSVVGYQGKTYSCVTPNTASSNFYTDLNNGLWSLILDGKQFDGPWQTNTFYSLGNIVIFGGFVYYCTTPHTSTAFKSQQSNWTQYTQYPQWLSTWQPNTVYGVGAVVQYGGIVYSCITGHTSTGALQAVGAVSTGSQVTITFTPQPVVIYAVGTTITLSGFNPTIINGTYTVVSSTQSSVTFASQITINGTIATPGISTGVSQLGLEANQSSWTVLDSNYNYVGAWAANTRYKLNDIVQVGGSLYACTQYNVSGIAFATSTYWIAYIPDQRFISGFNVSVTYQIGDIVTYGGNTYINNTASNNSGSAPSTDTIDWTLLTPNGSSPVDWITGQLYQIGTVVRRHGLVFQAVQDNTSQDPASYSTSGITYNSTGSSGTTVNLSSTSGVQVGMIALGAGLTLGQSVNSIISSPVGVTLNYAPDGTLINGQNINFVGINYLYWKLVIPGGIWYGRWASGASYIVGDQVIWGNTTYQCDQNHTASNANRPDLDSFNTYWKILAVGARKETLTSQGDIETFSNGAYSNIAIGTSGYTLRATNNNPTWSQINVVPNVFYVSALTGIDAPGYGKNWDRPWKTIAYAAATVGAGTQNTNTVALITQNKSWIQAEMVQWAQYQINNNISPYSTAYAFNSTKAARDIGLIIDAIAYDLARGGNSQSVATALAYFAYGLTSTFYNTAVAADMPYYLPMLNYALTLLTDAITQTTPAYNYQVLNSVSPVIYQNTSGSAAEASGASSATTLFNYIYNALATQSTSLLPAQNSGVSCVINVKTGTYLESLPIVVPANVSIIGDELRGVVVLPKTSIQTTCTATTTGTNLITVTSTSGLVDQMPIQFADTTILTTSIYTGFGGITPGQTYYVIGSTITSNQFSVALSPTTQFIATTTASSQVLTDVPNIIGLVVGATITGPGIQTGTTITGITIAPSNSSLNSISISLPTTVTASNVYLTSTGATLSLTSATGTMTVYAGDCLKDMFRCRNGTSVRNMTLSGLQGTLLAPDANNIQHPSGGAYTALDPGQGPNDSTAWIIRRSPFMENITTFGNGCTGNKIDGTLHNGGYKSFTSNDFTQVIQDGVGIWCTGPGALTECISVFCYFGYTGYFAEAGGRIRAANGNSSYGNYGVISSGFDTTEVPITGTVYNQSSQVQASVQSSLGAAAQLIKLNYANAGSAYNTTSTNMLYYSNNYLGSNWVSDGNIIFDKTFAAPTGNIEAYTMIGTGGTGTGYIYQNITLNPAGASYTNLPSTTNTGTGGGATFNVVVTSTGYTVSVNYGGTGYAAGNTLTISGALLGGLSGLNNCNITVNTVTGNVISSVVATGIVPTGSTQSYTASVYVYQGTATQLDIQAIYSGSSTRTSAINYNFTTNTITPTNSNGGYLPTQFGSQVTLVAGWYRIWFAFNDTAGLNNTLQLRIYPKGINGAVGLYNYLYGAQVEISKPTLAPSFYIENTGVSRYSAYAYYNVTGSGTGALLIGDELRSNSVFQTLVTSGGSGYLTAGNNAQGGTSQYIVLAQSDVNQPSNYIGMRVFIQSGTGAGQYGYMATYNTTSKLAYVLKESFTPLQIASSSAVTSTFTLSANSTTSLLYLNMPVQFVPTYYTTTVTSTSLSQTTVTQAIGGTTNTLTLTSTNGLTVNMPIIFSAGSGAIFSTITAGYQYYVYAILSSTTIQISTQAFGTVWPLTSGSGTMVMSFTSGNSYIQASTTNMVVNYPIAFTGTAIGGLSIATTYYINDIIDSNDFTISAATFNITVTGTVNNTLQCASTTGLQVLNPIIFTAPAIAGSGIADTTKYYISSIVDQTDFTISTSIINQAVSSTNGTTNTVVTSSTSGFIVGQPIIFTGTTFGNILAETVYYILSLAGDGISFTISQTLGGGVFGVTTGTGSMSLRTCPTPLTFTAVTGSSMVGVTTSKKLSVNLGIGSMTGTFSTTLFGGISSGTTYYIASIPTPGNGGTFTVSTAINSVGVVVPTTKSGTMNLAAVGWDHVTSGFPIVPSLDSTSVYFIESRPTFSSPGFTQAVAGSTITLAFGIYWNAIAYGNNTFVAIPSANTVGATSTDGSNWSNMVLPSSASWSSIAFGNNYFVAVNSSNANVIYSNNNGSGWRTSTMPSNSQWTQIAYGNGNFVAIGASGTTSAYSTNFGLNWTNGQTISTVAATGFTVSAGTATVAFATQPITPFAIGSTITLSGFTPTTTSGTVNAVNTTFVVTGCTTSQVQFALTGTYSSGIFGTISGGNSAYGLPISQTWNSLAYGSNIFVAIGPGSLTGARSVNGGQTWISTTLPTASAWTSIAFGNGRFVAVANDGSLAIYSFDGITWYQSNQTVVASSVKYGQGVFVAVYNGSTTAYTSENGLDWTPRTVTNDLYTSLAFGFTSTNVGVFTTLSQQSTGSLISAGCRAKGRPSISSNTLNGVSEFEPGSGYVTQTISSFATAVVGAGTAVLTFSATQTTNPFPAGSTIVVTGFTPTAINGTYIVTNSSTSYVAYSLSGSFSSSINGSVSSSVTITFTDPNVTSLATVTPRVSNGTLGGPTFVNKGVGYSNTTTQVAITGNGYADTFQTGLTIVINNLSLLPSQGSNIQFAGNNSQAYKITSAVAVYGTVAPNIQANISISPAMTLALSPVNGAVATIRQKYSQCRITNHDFLYIGSGDIVNSLYPLTNDSELIVNNQTVEVNFGRVFFSSTDQDGNFKVGNLFGVQQATGIVTLSASQFGLTGLSTLSLGGISVGGSATIVQQFSTDGAFTANSDSIIPTQRAIRTYLASRLSQGGSNTYTGQMTAGTVVVGGAQYIRSSIPNGQIGSSVKMLNKVYVDAYGVDGNMIALDFFMNNSIHRSSSQQ